MAKSMRKPSYSPFEPMRGPLKPFSSHWRQRPAARGAFHLHIHPPLKAAHMEAMLAGRRGYAILAGKQGENRFSLYKLSQNQGIKTESQAKIHLKSVQIRIQLPLRATQSPRSSIWISDHLGADLQHADHALGACGRLAWAPVVVDVRQAEPRHEPPGA